MEENVRRSSYRPPDPTCRDNGRFAVSLPEAQRFWAKVDREHSSGCWFWMGTPNRYGYGRFTRTLAPGVKAKVLAHRFAYELVIGPIPKGLTLDHTCERTICVNPAHLDPVTNAENVRRMHERRRLLIGATA